MSAETASLQPATTMDRHRFHLLDGLRGLAALMVVAAHAEGYFQSITFVKQGGLAVDFFFCLSGFVIAFSYEKRLQANLTARQFLVARIIRLYPLCFLGMTAGFTLLALHHLRQHSFSGFRLDWLLFAEGLLLIPNLVSRYAVSLFPLDSAAWSLFFEFLGNAAYSIMIRKRIAQHKVLIAMACISGCFMMRWVFLGLPIWFIGWRNDPGSLFMGIPRFALTFATGILVFRLYKVHGKDWEWPSRAGAALPLIVTACLLFILIAPFRAMQSGAFTLASVTFAMPVIVYFGAMSRIPDSMSGVCSSFGEASYPLYLLHMSILGAFNSLLSTSMRPSLAPLYFVSEIAFASLLSLAVARWLDAPVRSFLRKKYNSFVLSSIAYSE